MPRAKAAVREAPLEEDRVLLGPHNLHLWKLWRRGRRERATVLTCEADGLRCLMSLDRFDVA